MIPISNSELQELIKVYDITMYISCNIEDM